MIFGNLQFTEVFADESIKILPDQFNVSSNKEWVIKFSKPVDLYTVNYNTISIKYYDSKEGKEKTFDITLDESDRDRKSVVIKHSKPFVRGVKYTLEVKNVKTSDSKEVLQPYKFDFYVKNIYAGLPAQNGLVIIKNTAYDAKYLKNNSALVNEILLSKDFDVYYNYDVSYQQILNLIDSGFIYHDKEEQKGPDRMTYVDPSGNKFIYEWNKTKEEYELLPAGINVTVLVRSDIKLVSILATQIEAVPDAVYFKLKHSNLIKPIGKEKPEKLKELKTEKDHTIAYTASEPIEEISILSKDKAVIAKGYLSVAQNNHGKCYLKVNDNYGAGNTLGNVNNNGLVTEDNDGYMYYANSSDKDKLYKYGMGGAYNIKLGEDKIQYLNVVNDWIYYSNYSDSGKLYKSKTNGSQRTKLCDDKAAYINLSGEYIYYSNHSDGGKLYRIKKDGSDALPYVGGARTKTPENEKPKAGQPKHGSPILVDNTKLEDNNQNSKTKEELNYINDEVAYVTVVGDWIYYSNFSDGHKAYVINKEATYRARLTEEWANSVQVYGDWVYYCSGSGIISKVKKDGSGLVVPMNATASTYNKGYYINVFGDWIYYSNLEDGNKLYKIKTDGSGEKVKLSDDAVTYINIMGRNIYYNTTTSKMMKLPVDGQSNVKPEEIGKTTSVQNVNELENVTYTVPPEKVRSIGKTSEEIIKSISADDSGYLPEKVAATLGNNTIQQLVVIWDRNPKNVTVKNGAYTYKGNVIGYNKTVTMSIIVPSEMLNDTNEVFLNNNGGKNDTIEVKSKNDGLGVKIQYGDIVKIYSSNDKTKNPLAQGTADRSSAVLVQKLDLSNSGESIWITITRKDKAESDPIEIKQPRAPVMFTNDYVGDLDKKYVGADGRDISLGENDSDKCGWSPSMEQNIEGYEDLKQQIYLVPTKTALDMKNFKPLTSGELYSIKHWKGNKDIKKDSKGNIIKNGTYDAYVTTEYSYSRITDAYQNRLLVRGKVSSDVPVTFTITEEKAPLKPTLKPNQKVKGGGEIVLSKAPTNNELAYLVDVKIIEFIKELKRNKRTPDELATKIRNEKWAIANSSTEGSLIQKFSIWQNTENLTWKEDEGLLKQIFDTFDNRFISKLQGDDVTNKMSAPLGLDESRIYRLIMVSDVGASDPSDAVATVDNLILTIQRFKTKSNGELGRYPEDFGPGTPAEMQVYLGEKIKFMSSKSGKAYLVSTLCARDNEEQLKEAVAQKLATTTTVRMNGIPYEIDTLKLSPYLDTVPIQGPSYSANYYLVVVDDVGVVSEAKPIILLYKIKDLKDNIDILEGVVEEVDPDYSKIMAAVKSAKNLLKQALETYSVPQSKIDEALEKLYDVGNNYIP